MLQGDDIAKSRSTERNSPCASSSLSIDEPDAKRQVRGGHHHGERNVYSFRNGAETRTLEFGHHETGEAYVRETGRGDITQFRYDAPARDVHMQLVERRAAREAPRDEYALSHAPGAPRQRHHHAHVVVMHANQETPHV